VETSYNLETSTVSGAGNPEVEELLNKAVELYSRKKE
jgi:hypothetical protein